MHIPLIGTDSAGNQVRRADSTLGQGPPPALPNLFCAMSKSRLEAFSDGVLAVAITLLVLNIHVPVPIPNGGHGDGLAARLGTDWPNYAAYAISFMTIGIIWINHHAMIGRLREADHMILILNLVLLMSVALLPFATDLLATYLRLGGASAKVAAAIYGGAFLTMSLAFSALNRHILIDKARLMHAQPSLAWRRATLRRASSGVLPYVLATALAAVSPYLTLVICGALALFYALPFASGTGVEEPEGDR